jgi:alpha-glucosidase
MKFFYLLSSCKNTIHFGVFDKRTSKTRLSKFLKLRSLLILYDCFRNESKAVFGVYLQRILILTVLMPSCSKEHPNQCVSPNNNIEFKVNTQDQLNYSVLFNGDTIIANSAIEVTLRNKGTLSQYEVMGSEVHSVNEQWERVWGKKKVTVNNHNALTLHLKETQSNILVDLYIRAFDDGVAFRYGFPEQEDLAAFEIEKERSHFNFTDSHMAWVTDYEKYATSMESEFWQKTLSEIGSDDIIGMPLLVKTDKDVYVAITEADLANWSGAFLSKTAPLNNSVVTDLAPRHDDSTIVVKSNAPAVSPWRVIMLTENPGGLIVSDIIANLNDASVIDDVSWIKPGVSAWDWWWCNYYAPSVDFELGPNQETMMYFIDFAAEMGWEYQIIDWQWYGGPFEDHMYNYAKPLKNPDVTTCIDGIDVPELVEYAEAKNVKLFVWLYWTHLDRQLDEALAVYEEWGVAGIKVDFMDRHDQEVVNFYHRVAEKAAKHKLLVNFHGAYKPTGVSRTYPNLITRENVLGNEFTKWVPRITAEHNVTLPFTRGLLGEMDYTPAAFLNVTPEKYRTEYETNSAPEVMSTRCHQLAMTVVFESALGVFCDSPDNYRKGIGTDFLKLVPTTWDETKVLAAEVGDYIVIARRSGNNWFVGGMTDGTERTLSFELSFLEDGKYSADIWQDAPDANENPMNAERKQRQVSAQDSLSILLAQRGGFTMVLTTATQHIAK